MQEVTPTDQKPESGLDESLRDSFLRAIAQSDLPIPLPGERLGGRTGKRYELQRVLGQGGMGAVFRAFDHELQRTVALKFLVLRDEGLDVVPLLREEAKAIARLDHENIVRIHDVAEWSVRAYQDEDSPPSSVPFLVMEYLEGRPLNALLKTGRLELRRALEIALDISAGLAHAHERHLVHRDIKPGNIFILPTGRAKLLDFGLARRTSLALPVSQGDTAGTPAYMSPEQWRGRLCDERSDVWAVGLVLFEMLTGERPFSRLGTRELRARVLSAEPMPSVRERRPELPEELARLVAAALVKEPEARIPHGAELLRRLRELQEHLTPIPARPRPEVPHWRQVTMVSCWLTPSEDIDPDLDPEDIREMEAAFHQACSRLVLEHGGSIPTCVGAEVLACLGYPLTRENDSEQAVHLALRLVREVRRELGRFSRTGLSVRVGVHTDQVVIADITPELHETTPALQGEAARVASWLAAQAPPDTVIISERTHALVAGSFQSEPLGSQPLLGPRGRVEVGLFRVLAARGNVFRFDRALVAGELTPLVGRERELRLLATWCEEGLRGGGRFILLRGEAGIGKSRLLQEFHDRYGREACIWMRCQCWLQFKSSAFYPLIDCLHRFIPLASGQPPEEKRGRLEARLKEIGLSPEHVEPLASLLSLPIPEGSPFIRLGPERQRELRVEALVAFLEQLARRQPVVVVLEDVHWADPSTLQFLEVLLGRLGGKRIVLLLTTRPELEHTWRSHPLFHELELERLTPELTGVLIHEVAGGRSVSAGTVMQLMGRTDGIPLFVEEMTRMVLDVDADRPLIPATLQEMLLARLDLLPPSCKALVQLASTLGREFSEELLHAVSFLDVDTLRGRLEHLEKARLLSRQGQPPAVTYVFRHALIQEAAYHSLLRKTRRQYHGRVVQVLLEQFPEQVECHPELLAQHHAGAGDADQAVEQWRRAGEHAAEKSAFAEACHHFNKGLEQLSRLPPSRERDRREVVLRAGLGLMLIALKGYTAQEAEAVYSRAFELCERLGDDVPLAVHWGLQSVALVRGEREAADRDFATQRRLVESSREPLVLLQAHSVLSGHCFWRGNYEGALRHSQEALSRVARYGASKFMSAELGTDGRHLRDVVLYAYMYHSGSDFACGRTRRASECANEALALAEATGQPYFVALVLTFTASRAYEQGRMESAYAQATRLRELSGENKFLFFLATGNCIQGAALAQRGDVPTGLERLQEGLGLLRAIGAMLACSYYLVMLAWTHLLAGQVEEGLAAVREGLELSEKGVAHRNLPSLKLVQGELLLQRGEVEAARASLAQSRELARRTGARRYALWAALRLASL
jgi:serine/threonine protein kinase/tetratricopeptide (TPR) repeat protein